MSFISYIEQNKQNCWHSQIRFRSRRSHVFTAIYRKRLIHIFFTKIAGGQPEKRLHQWCFLVKLPNISELFFAKHVWVVTASAKYHSFFLLRWPHQQNVTLDLSYILIIFKYFQSKHCESLVNSCFWKTKTISWFFTDKTSNTFKMFLEIKSSRPAVFSKFSLERICDEVIFS